jgi:preprotein translocase subunit SecE
MGGEQVQRMDIKKSRSNTSSSKIEGRKVVAFVGDVKQELKKVEWTNKDELKSYTWIVLVSTFVFGMFIYFIDLIIQGFLGGINLFVKLFTG